MPLCPKCRFIWTSTLRSGQQNRAFFGLAVKLIGDELGYDKEDMYKILAMKFIGYTEITIKGETYKVPKSTKSLTTGEFKTFMKQIQRWAATELNIIIPDPNEVKNA